MASLRLCGSSVPSITYKVVAARNLKSLNIFELQPAFKLQVEELKNAVDVVICNEFQRLRTTIVEQEKQMGLVLYPLQGHVFGSLITGKHEIGSPKGFFIITNNEECCNYVRVEIRKFIHSLYTKDSPDRRDPYMILDFSLMPILDIEGAYPTYMATQEQGIYNAREESKLAIGELDDDKRLHREMETELDQFNTFLIKKSVSVPAKSHASIQSVRSIVDMFRKLTFGTITLSKKYIIKPFGNPNLANNCVSCPTWKDHFVELLNALDWILVKEWARIWHYRSSECRLVHVHFKFKENGIKAVKFVGNVRLYRDHWRAIQARMLLALFWEQFRVESSFSTHPTSDYKLTVNVDDGQDGNISSAYMLDTFNIIKDDSVLFHQLFLHIKEQNRIYRRHSLMYPDVKCLVLFRADEKINK